MISPIFSVQENVTECADQLVHSINLHVYHSFVTILLLRLSLKHLLYKYKVTL